MADGRFGPNLRHLMSRDTIASGAASNTPANLRLWIQNPNAIKPGSLMPAMNLTDQQLNEVTGENATPVLDVPGHGGNPAVYDYPGDSGTTHADDRSL